MARCKRRAALRGIDLRTAVVRGHEVKAVVEFARENGFDLLVIGYTGHSSPSAGLAAPGQIRPEDPKAVSVPFDRGGADAFQQTALLDEALHQPQNGKVHGKRSNSLSAMARNRI